MALIVEPASNNARTLFAGVDIDAPVSVVWDALTDYDGLGTFIPGMAMTQQHCQMAHVRFTTRSCCLNPRAGKDPHTLCDWAVQLWLLRIQG